MQIPPTPRRSYCEHRTPPVRIGLLNGASVDGDSFSLMATGSFQIGVCFVHLGFSVSAYSLNAPSRLESARIPWRLRPMMAWSSIFTLSVDNCSGISQMAAGSTVKTAPFLAGPRPLAVVLRKFRCAPHPTAGPCDVLCFLAQPSHLFVIGPTPNGIADRPNPPLYRQTAEPSSLLDDDTHPSKTRVENSLRALPIRSRQPVELSPPATRALATDSCLRHG